MPTHPIDLSFLKFHSEEIMQYRQQETGIIEHYLLKSFSVITEMHAIGLLAALFILGIWLYFIRSLDFFNTEKIWTTLLALFTGIVTTFFTFALSDLINDGLGILWGNNMLYNFFIYCGLGIGVVEETIKAIPVLIILLFTSEIDEPFDIIYYASVSALGFAFTENLIYFRDLSGELIIGRALTSAIGHMIFASIAYYGVVLAKFKFKSYSFRSILNIMAFGLAGAMLHGLYDFLLFIDYSFLFIMSFVLSIQIWLIIINNTINSSKYFSYKVVFKHDKVKFNIAILLVWLLIFSHFINGLLYGIYEANHKFFGSFIFVGMLIFFYISNMSSLDLFKGHWRPVKFIFNNKSNESSPANIPFIGNLINIFKHNTIHPLNHVGKNIWLHAPKANPNLAEALAITKGTIADRVKVIYPKDREDIDWFLVNIDQPMDVQDQYKNKRVLIKIRDKSASLIHDEHIDCWLKIIPDHIEIARVMHADDLISCGLVIINGSDYRYPVELQPAV